MSFFSINDVTVGEGDGQATFRITLSEPLSETASVDYGYDQGTTNRFRDFETLSGTLTFQPGEVEQQVPVLINQDDNEETDESLFLTLSNPSGATISDDLGRATILDDDGPAPTDPTVSVDPFAVAETGGFAETVLRLNGPVGEPVELDYTTIAGTADSGDDFTAREDDLTFIPGELAKTVRVPITDDGSLEGFEDFSLALSNVTGASVERTDARVVIADNDGPTAGTPAVRAGDVAVGENAGAAVVPVMLSAPSSEATSIRYSYDQGTTNRFRDFETFSGTLTFRPGETRKEIPVLINQDTASEQRESLFIELSSPSGLSLASNSSGQITIVDDDAAGSGPRYASVVGSDERTITEGEVQSFEIPVSLTRPADQAITADVSVSGDSTLSPDEYVLGAEELVFRPGDVAQSLTVFVDDDEAFESTETIEVSFDLSGERENVDTDEVSFELTIVDDEISITRSGSSDDDVLRPGQDAAYIMYAGGGDDRLTGGEYADTLYGGRGRDFIVGANGSDTVYGGGGNDEVFAGASDTGNDTIRGGAGNDTLGGGAGDDEIYGQNDRDTIFGGLGDDVLEGQQGGDTIWAGSGGDLVRGGDGNDTLGGGNGNDRVRGDNGNDTLYGGADNGADTLNGGGGRDTIFGGGGNDTIAGGGGTDTLYNGGGVDTVAGGGGADLIWGGGGNDTLTGGDGADVFAFVRGNGDETITDFDLDADMIRIESGPNGFGGLDIGGGGTATVSFADVTITLEEVAQGELSADAFMFT